MKTAAIDSKSSSSTHQTTSTQREESTFFSLETDVHAPFFSSTFLQPKLTIGSPNDPLEHEANRTADHVVESLNSADTTPGDKQGGFFFNTIPFTPVQRFPAAFESEQEQTEDTTAEEFVQRKLAFDSDAPSPPDDDPIQRSSTTQGQSTDQFQRTLTGSKHGGSPLPQHTRHQMEGAFGADFDNVRIHTGSDAVQMNREIGAQAFTHGSDIYFSEGTFQPESKSGQHLLAHELTHTIQQGSSRLIQKKSSTSNPNDQGSKEQDALTQNTSHNNTQEQLNFQSSPQESEPQNGQQKEQEPPNNPSLIQNAVSNPQITGQDEKETLPAIDRGTSTNSVDDKKQEGSSRTHQNIANSSQNDQQSNSELEVGFSINNQSQVENPNSFQLKSLTPELPTAVFVSNETQEFIAFLNKVKAIKSNLLLNGEEQKNLIRNTSKNQKENIKLDIENEATGLEDRYNKNISNVLTAANSARFEVISTWKSKSASVELAAITERTNMKRVVEQSKIDLRNKSESKVKEANSYGSTQSMRAIRHSREQASKVAGIVQGKINKYQNYDRASRITRVIKEMGSRAIGNIVNSGLKISSAVLNDAEKLANKFKKEGREAVVEINKAFQLGKDRIENERTGALKGLLNTSIQTINTINISERDAVTQLKKIRNSSTQSIRNLSAPAVADVERATEIAELKVDERLAIAANEIDSFAIQIGEKLGNDPREQSKQQLDLAAEELDLALGEFNINLDNFRLLSQQLLENASIKVAERLIFHSGRLVRPGNDLQSKFESQVGSASQNAIQKMNTSANDVQASMKKAVSTTKNKLEKTITESELRWKKELAIGKSNIKKKVDDGIINIDKILFDLPSKIDKEAERIENEGLLDRIGNFALGILSGFIKKLGRALLSILKVVLVILAVVVVVALIIVAIGGLKLLMAIVLAVGLFIAVNAAIIGVIIKVAIVLAIAYTIVVVAIAIYEAATRDDLSDWERGELVGGAAFEVAENFVFTKILSKLGKLLKLFSTSDFITDLLRLRRLRKAIGDEATLARLLNNTKDDALLLEKLIGKVNDVPQLERMLILSGDAKTLNKLTDSITDLATLERLLGKVNNGAQLERLISKVGDAKRLESILDKTSDATQAEKLLSAFGDDAVELENLLLNAPTPFGFKNPQEVANFGSDLYNGLANKGIDDAVALMQGSAVTGKSFRTGRPFDAGRTSDFDVALASPKLLELAKKLKIGLRSKGIRTGPLKAEDLKALGLDEIADLLKKNSKREVNFMIFESVQAARSKAASILIL